MCINVHHSYRRINCLYWTFWQMALRKSVFCKCFRQMEIKCLKEGDGRSLFTQTSTCGPQKEILNWRPWKQGWQLPRLPLHIPAPSTGPSTYFCWVVCWLPGWTLHFMYGSSNLLIHIFSVTFPLLHGIHKSIMNYFNRSIDKQWKDTGAIKILCFIAWFMW